MNRSIVSRPMSLIALAVMAVLAACSAVGSVESAPPLGSDGCGAEPAARIAATLAASRGSQVPEPDRHAAPELEALLPNTIAGAGFSVNSFRWEAGSADTLTPLLGKRPENMCYAYASPIDPAKLAVGITVHRIVGVQATELRTAMLKSWFNLDLPPDLRSVGGKEVILVHFTGSAMLCCSDGPVYMYAWGEALFTVLPADADVAATALQALP